MTRKLIADPDRVLLVTLIMAAIQGSKKDHRDRLQVLLRDLSGVDKRLTVETAADNWKPSMGQRIERLYAWVAEEADGGEGIVGWNLTGAGWTPLIGADKDRIESYRQHAELTVSALSLPVRLKVFGDGVTIDEIKP